MSLDFTSVAKQSHPFDADDSGQSCIACGLPEANARHLTFERLHKKFDKAVDQAADAMIAARKERGRMALLALTMRVKMEDPLARYVNYSTEFAYDKGHTWLTTDLRAVHREDGTPALWADTKEPMDDEGNAMELDCYGYGHCIFVDYFDIDSEDEFMLDLSFYDIDKALVDGDALKELLAKIG